jgi:hypothetical protein
LQDFLWLGLAQGLDPGRYSKESAAYPLPTAEMAWRDFLAHHFPSTVSAPFAARHISLHEWFDTLVPGTKPRPRVEVWGRGGAKSSTGELGIVRVGAKLSRHFVLIVSETQAQADSRVSSISSKFESMGVGRLVGKYGTSKGWKRDQIRTANGFNVAGLGLDTGARGIKLDDFRPDLIVFDDIDGRHDSAAAIAKKIETITQTILPAGSSDCAILFLQNLISKNGIVSQLYFGKADFLLNRETPTFDQAVKDLKYEMVLDEEGYPRYIITGGTPTWAGQSLATCEAQMNEWGRKAFLREAQHEVFDDEDGLWARERDINPFRVSESPELYRICVSVDPSASSKSTSDEAGIMIGGLARIHGKVHGFLLDDKSLQGSPSKWALEAVAAFKTRGASVLVAEANNGGEMVSTVIGTVLNAPVVKLIHASKGKLTRAEPVQKLCEDGRIHHIGNFDKLEDELCTWKPGDPSPNRLDAYVWLFTELMLGGETSSEGLAEAAAFLQSDNLFSGQTNFAGYGGGVW